MNNTDVYKNKETLSSSSSLQNGNGNGYLPHSSITPWNSAKLNENPSFFPSNPSSFHPGSLLHQFDDGSPVDDLDEVELS